jgi:hypothetical protein
MTRCESVARPWDNCATCKPHAVVELVPGANHLLCRHPAVLAAFERERVAATLARGTMCAGRLHSAFPKAAA